MPGKDEEFYLGNSFALEVDSVAVALFTEVSGLESTTDVIVNSPSYVPWFAPNNATLLPTAYP